MAETQAVSRASTRSGASSLASSKTKISTGRTSRFSTTNHGCHVDDLLFECPSEKNLEHERDAVQIVTKDLIRNLFIPHPEPPVLTKVLSKEEYTKIKNAARVLTAEERNAQVQKYRDEKDAIQNASQSRKSKFKKMDAIRQENAKLTDLEEEAKQRSEYLLQHANELRQEQEDEIKHLNEMILNARIQTIRDSQVVEKQLIKKELKNLNELLDEMMEKNRQEGLQKEDQVGKKRKQQNHLYGKDLHKQMDENEENRLLQQEKKIREGEQMLKYLQQLQLEDFQAMQDRKNKQRLLMESLLKENNEIMKRKQYEKKREKHEDLWVIEFQRQKAEKEIALEKEAEEAKKQREQEIAKLRVLQEKAKDEQAEKDAVRARRAQDEKEREWRRKEKEAAIKKKKTEEMLRSSRDNQIKLQDTLKIMKAENEQKEYEALLGRVNTEIEKERLSKQFKRESNLKYANELRKEIAKKEEERIADRQAHFKEGVHLRNEEKQRQARLEEVKKRKMKALRDYKVPDKYLNEIERKVRLRPTTP